MTNDHTPTEERLIRALAARAEQVTPHSLRPAAPPTGNWAARGRAPLVLALAASVASVALVGTAAVSLLAPPEKAPVAGTPSAVPEPPVSRPPGPSAPGPSAPPVGPPPPGTTPSGGTGVPGTGTSPDPGTSTGTGTGTGTGGTGPGSGSDGGPPTGSRTVTVLLGEAGATRTLRTGGDALTLTVTVLNTTGGDVENATDNLSLTAEGGTLSGGDVNMSLLAENGTWRPIGHTARLTTATLPAGESRTHRVRVSLPERFPASVTRLRVTAFSNAGEETIT
ncbi:hypothetical protein [Streptomyces fradiae]|uniref:hypothetical protein n=1 Tax=Streptomyces fradiae TaxID=1906 RepID=UPI0029421CD4|nr:hypothetical protein [Streptomyces fradiae]WOI58785.1 hypothetical protein RYQ63_01940 [Streptomyces fradiae]